MVLLMELGTFIVGFIQPDRVAVKDGGRGASVPGFDGMRVVSQSDTGTETGESDYIFQAHLVGFICRYATGFRDVLGPWTEVG